jgi:hypothetical protein
MLSCHHHAGNKGEKRYSSYSFLISILNGSEWSVSCPCCALPLIPGTHWIGGWVDLRADLEARGKIMCLSLGSNPCHPVVQSVVRRYTDWATPATWYLVKQLLNKMKLKCCNHNIYTCISCSAQFEAQISNGSHRTWDAEVLCKCRAPLWPVHDGTPESACQHCRRDSFNACTASLATRRASPSTSM